MFINTWFAEYCNTIRLHSSVSSLYGKFRVHNRPYKEGTALLRSNTVLQQPIHPIVHLISSTAIAAVFTMWQL